ncbi:CcdB family protein [Marinobacter sp. SS21]|uniref:CcdB family protein n=1 Tax=Marinobacter sp. SS21 TaxID=2979460 RepID=UPI00232A98BF|nr:CcdB family protein [Marinobacter sp. SS21]MDC0664154.1 CcdB family protein [Marinobacter sp. SS21]
MSQFTLYENTDRTTRKAYPYFLDVQTDLISVLNSRIVIPVIPAQNLEREAPEHLCPIFQIDGNEYALLTHQLTSAPASILKRPAENLEAFREEIINAIDFLITGI